MAGGNDAECVQWLNEAFAAHNAMQAETAVTFAEKVIATEGCAPDLARRALGILLSNAMADSQVNRRPITETNQRYVAAIRADPRYEQVPAWQDRRSRLPGAIRIGYFWDFIGRSVDLCFPGFHNRKRYEVIGVTRGNQTRRSDDLSFDRLIEYDPQDVLRAVAQVREADIDLLIILNGRGGDEVSDLIVEARVASKQALYGNFFWSAQSPSIDFLIADHHLLTGLDPATTPEGLIAIEAPIMAVRNLNWVPHSRQDGVPARPRRYRIGTPGNRLKLSDGFLDLLAKTLAAHPDFSFFYHSCRSPDDLAELSAQLTRRGIESERLELFVSGQIGYVDGINAMDAAIDTIPYNGHLSTVEYLSLGTPIWSLRGDGFAQRYGEMMLGCVGLEENIFTDAAALIEDLGRRITLKDPSATAALVSQVARSGITEPLRATRLFEKAIDACLHVAFDNAVSGESE